MPPDGRHVFFKGKVQMITYLRSNKFNYYTIPSDNRELQLIITIQKIALNYIIPSDNRELQRGNHKAPANENYTIPSDNEENQKSILKLRKNRNQPLHYNKKQETL